MAAAGDPKMGSSRHGKLEEFQKANRKAAPKSG
jgi:hypothetical protein